MKVPIKRIHMYRSHCSRWTAGTFKFVRRHSCRQLWAFNVISDQNVVAQVKVQADKQYDGMVLDRSEQSKERLHENQLCDLMNFDHRSTATKGSLLQPHPLLHSIALVHKSLSIKFCNKSNGKIIF